MKYVDTLHTQDRPIKRKSGISCWVPPTTDVLKINFDGAFLKTQKKGAWGFIVRDHTGASVVAGAGRINVVHDALSAESQACLAALYVAIDHGLSQIILETDSTTLVDALQSRSYDFSACGVLFREAKFLMSMNFIRADVVHVPRSSNRCAHELARIGLNWDPDRSHVWIDPLPEFVQELVSHDVNDSLQI